MSIPKRTFEGKEGMKATGTMGPEALKTDIDGLIKILDPSKEGIKKENLSSELKNEILFKGDVIEEKDETFQLNFFYDQTYKTVEVKEPPYLFEISRLSVVTPPGKILVLKKARINKYWFNENGPAGIHVRSFLKGVVQREWVTLVRINNLRYDGKPEHVLGETDEIQICLSGKKAGSFPLRNTNMWFEFAIESP